MRRRQPVTARSRVAHGLPFERPGAARCIDGRCPTASTSYRGRSAGRWRRSHATFGCRSGASASASVFVSASGGSLRSEERRITTARPMPGGVRYSGYIAILSDRKLSTITDIYQRSSAASAKWFRDRSDRTEPLAPPFPIWFMAECDIGSPTPPRGARSVASMRRSLPATSAGFSLKQSLSPTGVYDY